MPRLNVVAPADATGEVKEIYDDLKAKMGKVINIFQGMGNSAAALKAYLGMAGALKDAQLSPADREAIYLAVSEQNGCTYCVSAHTMLAKKVGLSDEEIIAIRKQQPQDTKQQALVKFANRVIETKGFVEQADLDAIRSAGYADGEIAETCAQIALAVYTNLFNHVYDTELDFPAVPEV